MKYFTKLAFLGFGKKEEPKEPQPFKTYGQTIQGLPTHALKKRLAKLQAQAGAYGDTTMPDNVKSEFDGKIGPVLDELKSRGES